MLAKITNNFNNPVAVKKKLFATIMEQSVAISVCTRIVMGAF